MHGNFPVSAMRHADVAPRSCCAAPASLHSYALHLNNPIPGAGGVVEVYIGMWMEILYTSELLPMFLAVNRNAPSTTISES